MRIEQVADLASLKEVLSETPNGPYAVDLETTGLDQWKDKITHVVVANENAAAVVQVTGSLGWVGDWLLSLPASTQLVFHNSAYDLKMLYRAGVDLRGKRIEDTMLLHHLDSPDAPHSLDSIVQSLWGDDYKRRFWDDCGGRIENATGQALVEYAGKDGVYTTRLFRHLQGLTAGYPSLVAHVYRLARSLLDTEIEGVPVDIPYLTSLGETLLPLIEECRRAMDKVEPAAVMAVRLDNQAILIDRAWTPTGKKWKNVAIPEFNWSSHKQLGALLYDKLKLPEQVSVDKKTKEKRRSVDDTALSALELHHVLPKMLREHAEYKKVYTAFIEGTLQRMHDGRIYPSFNVNGTVTGRISSENPNLQQLPSKGEWARVRGIYVADPDSLIVSTDYSQLEVVIAAHFSQDPNLLRVILGGESKHDITAAALGIPRDKAKTINFGMQYGCGPGKVAEILGLKVTEDERGRKQVPKAARDAWNQYWKTYAGERKVIDECSEKVVRGEPIVSPWGRRRLFPTQFAEKWQLAAAQRQAYSTLIQGTGADCCHYAFYTVAETLKRERWGRALFEVHDQIVCSVKKEYLQQATKFIEEAMIGAGKVIGLTVPLSVESEEPKERWTK